MNNKLKGKERFYYLTNKEGYQVLEEYINKKNEKVFKDLKYKGHLRFDFEILIDNKIGLIEYDGQQHFKPINFTSNISKEKLLNQFNELQLRDQLKNEYYKKNKIPLLRISYKLQDNEIKKEVIKFILSIKYL